MVRLATLAIFFIFTQNVKAEVSEPVYWMKIKAKDRFERSYIADKGVSIESIDKDFVIALGTKSELESLKASGRVLLSFEYKSDKLLDFPKSDDQFHNYKELTDELNQLANNNPDLVEMKSLGKTHENRDIWVLRITKDVKVTTNRPAVIFMGGHHAREHISIEMPLMLAKHLVSKAVAQDQKITDLLANREIHIIPMVNPDGAEYDIASGSYQMWRKNRRKNGDGTVGVDLNRNYGYQWGTGGSSSSGSSDVYMGKTPFSEPETQAIRDYVNSFKNITILLSFHTFSELILYPWGHSYDSIAVQQDKLVHETMARTMAKWNGYTPQQSSDLYIASGDTTDWSYGENKIISFTFELDPKNMWSGGFYPGQAKIPVVFNKNLEPCLYLIDLADNPYRVLQPSRAKYGLNSPLVQ